MSEHSTELARRDLATEALERIAMAGIREQRAARRWGIFFKLLLAVYIGAMLFVYQGAWSRMNATPSGDHIALIDINGEIDATGQASAVRVNRALRQAFRTKDAKAVILQINSPGGSPVQSRRIYDEILRLKSVHPDKPVYAVAGDIMASGGYYIAAAADEIYADRGSIVGSIGVVMQSFGVGQALERLGIERRVYTAGADKAFMDPFAPAQPEHVAHIEGMVTNIHQQFVEAVRDQRGARLQERPGVELFSGLVWTGEQALDLGLVDALGSHETVARRLDIEAVVTYNQRPPMELIQRLLNTAARAGASALSEEWAATPRLH